MQNQRNIIKKDAPSLFAWVRSTPTTVFSRGSKMATRQFVNKNNTQGQNPPKGFLQQPAHRNVNNERKGPDQNHVQSHCGQMGEINKEEFF